MPIIFEMISIDSFTTFEKHHHKRRCLITVCLLRFIVIIV